MLPTVIETGADGHLEGPGRRSLVVQTTALHRRRITDRGQCPQGVLAVEHGSDHRRAVPGGPGGGRIGGLGDDHRPGRRGLRDVEGVGWGDEVGDLEALALAPDGMADPLGDGRSGRGVIVAECCDTEPDPGRIEPGLGRKDAEINDPRRERGQFGLEHLGQDPVGQSQGLIGEQCRTGGGGERRYEVSGHRRAQQFHGAPAGFGLVHMGVGAIAREHIDPGAEPWGQIGVQVQGHRDGGIGPESLSGQFHQGGVEAVAVDGGGGTVQAQHQAVEGEVVFQCGVEQCRQRLGRTRLERARGQGMGPYQRLGDGAARREFVECAAELGIAATGRRQGGITPGDGEGVEIGRMAGEGVAFVLDERHRDARVAREAQRRPPRPGGRPGQPGRPFQRRFLRRSLRRFLRGRTPGPGHQRVIDTGRGSGSAEG